MEMNFLSINAALLSALCVMLAFIVSPSLSAGLITQCSLDSECDSDEYCSNGMCEACVPCEWLNRETPAGGRKCARNEDECGSCLPWFQSEELTNQRRSYKCQPMEQLEAVQFVETMAWGPLFLGSVFFVVVTAAALTTYYFRRGTRPQTESPEKGAENEGLIPSAPYLPPPPYNLLGVDEAINCRATQAANHICEPYKLMSTVHIGATPIGAYHHHYEPVQVEPELTELVDEEIDFNPVLIHEESNDSVPLIGSTETIPSQWEPGSAADVNESPAQMSSFRLHRVRSQSFEHLPFFARPEHAPIDLHSIFAGGQRSRSDPEIMSRRRASYAGETYAHRHVRLSSHRSRSNQGTNEASSVNIQENAQISEERASTSMPNVCDTYEAASPSPFAYSDSEEHVESAQLPYVVAATLLNQMIQSSVPNESSAGGSLDSGFFDDSRRRRVPSEGILEFGFAIYAKRFRRE